MKLHIFRLAIAWLPRVPRRISLVLGVGIGHAIWLLAGGMRRDVRRRLAHIPPLAADPQRLDRAVRLSFVHLVLNYVDLFAPPAEQNSARFIAAFPLHQLDLFREILRQEHGCIILSLHTDAFEATLYRDFGREGRSLTAPAEAIEPPELFRLIQARRERSGVAFPPVNEGATLRTMITTLRAGNVVLMALDRDVLRTGMAIPLFGVPTRIPTGPVALARKTGAPIILAQVWREGLGRYRGRFVPCPLALDPAQRGDDAMRAALTALVGVLEQQILEHPEQWLAVFARDVWEPELRMPTDIPSPITTLR